MKAFLAYRRYDSVTNMLLMLGLPSCDTIWHSDTVYFNPPLKSVGNSIAHNCEF